ncbi:TlpA family protein disulfide reductase [Corynebacterium hindlerae]|uniref:TlpA family protein disulfide reductase n=1 Tax=Corynebacterium hindlerae TaxID=699041 RepID=A0A7G5FHY1_9CORY|nr:TlpA disulfide reductase family protein [Corynebacterium hindlerae]QMV86222.1 TlpA family protein disulfide reductase [Corynebacterium hindlerae]
MKRSLIAVCVALSLAGCSAEDTAGQDAVAIGGTWSFVAPGGQTDIKYPESERKPIREFSGESVQGGTVNLSDFAGQVVVINAWGQWCGPCRSESDDMQEIHEKLQETGKGTVLGVNVKDYQRQISRDFMTDNGLTYPSLYDPPFKTAAAMGGLPASVIPTTIILDKQHRPAAVFLREVTAQDVLDVALPLTQEA